MLRDHIAISQEVVSYDCPKCMSGGVCFVGMFVNGFRPMSRREQRRARKARKNLVMYKTAGRRPWRWVNQICGARYILKQQSPDILRWSLEAYDWDREDMQYPLSHLARRRNVHSHRIAWLRERSGFLAMSKLAEGMR